ncbi:MAG: LysR family transcriptional regulator [Paracoccaceae bacterium]
MQLRFRQLQAFHAIIDTGTVTGAATLLGISQPGISNLIAQLERETRLDLFSRTKGRLLPTPEADVLYQEIDTVVRGLDHVQQTVTDLQNKQVGQLQAASTHALSFGFLPRLIARFCEGRPNLSVSFQSQYSPKIQEWVMAGLFEVGICELPIQHQAFDAHVFRFETVCAMAEDNPLARYDVLTPTLLKDEAFIVMGPDHMTHRRTREAFHSAGEVWRPQVNTHLFKNMLSFVREGMGVSLIDPFTVAYEDAGGFIKRPFEPAIMLDMAVITSKTRPLSTLAQEFRAVLLAEMQSYAATTN